MSEAPKYKQPTSKKSPVQDAKEMKKEIEAFRDKIEQMLKSPESAKKAAFAIEQMLKQDS